MHISLGSNMDVSRDDEVPPPPPVPMAYYMPTIPSYAPMYFPDPAIASQYGYHVSSMGMQSAPIPMLYPEPSEIMSIIPTLRCWSCTKCGNLNYAHRLTCNLRKCQKMSSDLAGAGEADWMCACGNVNYRFRKYCNLRKCQLPQIGNPYLFYGISQLIKNGYSSQAALSLLLTNGGSAAPPSDQEPSSESREAGCWKCNDCGNLNWPWRESCNRKGCSQIRTSCTL